MAHAFAQIMFTPRVKAVQAQRGSRGAYEEFEEGEGLDWDRLGPEEAAFVAARDSFYMASVSETGWPYVQHRGGPPGFLKVIDERTLAFPDFRGNRQYVSVGNLLGDNHVSLILMDYPRRRRLKVLGHARLVEAAQDPGLVAGLQPPGVRAPAERAFVIDVAALDWNCQQHITPRFSQDDVEALVSPLQARIAELEARLASSTPAPPHR